MNTEKPSMRADLWSDPTTWEATLQSAGDGTPAQITFPSHVPEVFEAISGAWGRFGALTERLDEAVKSGATIQLVHLVDGRTVRHLPDLVRYIDDRWPEIHGLRFELGGGGEDIPDLLPWWRSAVSVCVSREIPFQVGDGLPDGPGSGPRERPGAPPDPPHPEPISTLIRPTEEGEWLSGVDRLLDPIGTLARFVHWQRLDVGEELLREYIAQEPRDRSRAERDTRERPWVLLQVATVQDPDGSVQMASARLVAALAQRCLDLDTDPQVVVALDGETVCEGLEDLEAACAGLDVPVHRAHTQQNGPLDEDTARFDYVIVLGVGAPSPSLTRQTLCLVPAAEREALMEALSQSWTDPRWDPRNRPVSNWLPELWGPALSPDVAAAPMAETRLDVSAGLRVDLWIADCPALGTLLAATDPVPMDRFLMDAHQVEPSTVPWFSAAQDASLPWVTHEGAMLGGTLASSVVDKPEQTRARVPRDRPLTILGIASTTLANHSATLVRDGQVVAAVQEERLRRRKQLGWHPPGRPYTTVVSDPAIPLERAWPKRSIQTVLAMAGLTMDEVDVIAVNGIPARYFPTYSLRDQDRPPVTIHDGRTIYIPHHLTHAASAYRVSGMPEDAVVFTVDGRGERETAAFFHARDGALERTFDILCNEDSLVGGVYEYITTILGFGHYGQGSTMGLAAMGDPGFDMSPFLSANSRDDYAIHDRGIWEAWGHLSRDRDAPLDPAHITLAASIQAALEETVIRLMEDGLDGGSAKHICLAGGVALNCAMNQKIRLHFGPEQIFVQPGAHDAGTSLGAAMEAHFLLTGEAVPTTMTHALLGPSYTDEEIAQTLSRFGLTSTRPTDIARDVAELVAGGRVVCWFQGGMEFGPRALGGRSILSDPRDVTMKSRVNRMKGRQWWRPFGPSILAGREADWFDTPMESPFMLFTLPVRPDRQDEIPAVVHLDGTSRPQSVNATDQPRYHAMISAFEALTGVPMVTNTSFNTAFEPIVCSPEDAISSFLQLEADYLAMGDHLVERAALDPRRLRGT